MNICAKIENEFIEHIREFENSRIWRIRTPRVNKRTLLVQTQDKEESEEYFISLHFKIRITMKMID